jgi:hypothetical protein
MHIMGRDSSGVRVVGIDDICGEVVVRAVGPRRVVIGNNVVDTDRLVIATI